MKKFFLSLALMAMTISAFAQFSVTLANAHWGFETGEATRPTISAPAFSIPANWVVGANGSAAYLPYIYPNGNQTTLGDQGYTGHSCLFMTKPSGTRRLPVFAMLPTVSDKKMSTLTLEFYARTFNSTLDTQTSNTILGTWEFGYLTSLDDTVKANFTDSVHFVQTLNLTANWTKYSLALTNFPDGAYPVIYKAEGNDIFYGYLDDVAYVTSSSSNPNPDPEPEPTTYTVTYNLIGCEGDSENITTFGEEEAEFDLYFTLTEGFSWDGVEINITMGETVLDNLEENYEADPYYYWESDGAHLNIGYIEGWFDDNITVTITAKKELVFPTEFTPATFDDVTVGTNGVYYDPNLVSGNNAWLNGSFKFYTYYSAPYMPGAAPYYSDIVVSSLVDPNMAADYNNPVSYLYAPAQTPDGSNFAVWNQNYYGIQNVHLNEARTLTGMYVNNTSAVLNYLTDTYTTFPANGYYMLTVTGLNNGVQTGTVNCYLVDWRNAQSKKTVTDWEWLDLTSLQDVDELNFNVYSDDAGQWGLNIPAYFCFDNLGGTPIVTGLENTPAVKATKILRNGQVIILRDGKEFTILGHQK